MTPLDEFCMTLSQLTDVVKTITDIEQSRAEAASQKEHNRIQGFLNEEQAAILTLRGLEQKRMQQAEALGWKGLTFRQILDTAGDAQKKVLMPRFTELQQAVSLLVNIREGADRIIKVRIRDLQDAIAVAGGPPEGSPSHFFHDKYV